MRAGCTLMYSSIMVHGQGELELVMGDSSRTSPLIRHKLIQPGPYMLAKKFTLICRKHKVLFLYNNE